MVIVSSGRRRALRLLRSLLAWLEDQVAVLDARGFVLDVNESWRRLGQLASYARMNQIAPPWSKKTG
jgi:hypothetical protein